MYYSEKCSWFYICLLILGFGLILMTVIDGFQVAESALFIILELFLNILIGFDLGFRVKLVGFAKYIKDQATGKLRWWNIFDAIVVVCCIMVFVTTLISKTGMIKGFEEAGEEALIVIWCIWQSLRMIVIAKK